MRTCPVCHKSEVVKIVDLNYQLFDDLNMSGQMQLVKCSWCDFIYNRTCLTEEDFSNYYKGHEHYVESASPGSGGNSDRDIRRYRQIYDQVQACLPEKEPSILDFGCGKGGMLRWLSQNVSTRVAGLEAGSPCRTYIEQKLNLPVYENLSQINRKFDLVVLSHVLEHLYFPQKVMQSLSGILNQNAVIYIEVPSADAYLSPTINLKELYFEHINHFTASGLQNLTASQGFHMLETGIKPFYPDDPDSVSCRYGIFRKRLHKEPVRPGAFNLLLQTDAPLNLPVIENLIKKSKPVSIWGISQYTQLILGSYPKLLELTEHIFDGSKAKIGRSVRGIQIRSSRQIPSSGPIDTLLMPVSSYMDEMSGFLKQIDFKGTPLFF